MGIYLIDNPPVRDQFYRARNRALTGCTVLHTAESLMDTVGPDTGAESVANFIRTRTTPGSYHDLCDSDSAIQLVPYESGAYHDGTGSNNWALSISWACGTHHWRVMTADKRRAFLRQGAIAFARQQAWRKARGYPLTELRRITKAQSDAGASGFIYHGDRDPDRRTDPGKNPPNLFPFDEFVDECRAVMGGDPEKEWWEMAIPEAEIEKIAQRTRQVIADGSLPYGLDNLRRRLEALTAQVAGSPDRVAAAVVAALPEQGSGEGGALTKADVEGAVRDVLGGLDDA